MLIFLLFKFTRLLLYDYSWLFSTLLQVILLYFYHFSIPLLLLAYYLMILSDVQSFLVLFLKFKVAYFWFIRLFFRPVLIQQVCYRLWSCYRCFSLDTFASAFRFLIFYHPHYPCFISARCFSPYFLSMKLFSWSILLCLFQSWLILVLVFEYSTRPI